MTDPIYVVDTETTGLTGCPYDHVVEVGIVGLDVDQRKVWDVYSCVVGYDVSSWDPFHKNAWVFDHTGLRIDDVRHGRPQSAVCETLKTILSGNKVTSYNTPFDFQKFLYREPWGLYQSFTEFPDIMTAAANVFKIPSRFGGYSNPKLENAYGSMCPDDPANICGRQDHRAQSDARVAAYLLLAMIDMGKYPEVCV